MNKLLNKFKTGEKPTGEDFRELIKSCYDGMGVPDYWEEHLSSKIKTIKSLQDEDGTNRFSIGFITDMHLDGNSDLKSGSLINEIEENIHMPIIINGGDCISHYQGAISKNNALNQVQKMFNMFSPRVKDKMLYMVANHDDNSHSNQNWANTLKEGELYSQFYRYLDNKVIRGETPRYYYLDNEFHKTRFIVLDCNDVPYVEQNGKTKYPISNYHPFRQRQLEWFANTALNVHNDEWSVIVTCHAPPYSKGVKGFDRPVINGGIALGILSAFKEKKSYVGSSDAGVLSDFNVDISCDFTGKGGNVICWITGDTHRDNIVEMKEYSNIKLVTTVNDHKNRLSGEIKGVSGTITEHAFDIITVDRGNKDVYLTRIGAGSDRKFSYIEGAGDEDKKVVVFNDNFNRNDSLDLGSDWKNERGQFRIVSNDAKSLLENGTTSISLVNQNIVQNNIDIESSFNPKYVIGYIVRYVDSDNYIRVMVENNDFVLTVVKNDVKTNISAKGNYGFSESLDYKIKIELRGTNISVFINDVLELEGISDEFLSSTKCGIRAWSQGGPSGIYRDFIVKEIV